MWLKFKEWADIYGPIYKTEMLGATFLVISDEKIAEELLVKRAKIYSDRPAIRSLFDSKSTHGSMEYLPLMGKNKYWARQRRFTHAYLTQASNNHYYGVMNFEVKRCLARLCEDPDNFSFTLEDMASKIMCQLTWDDTSFSAYYMKNAWGLLTQMSPAGPITNVLTPLWHLPFAINPWQRAERKRHDEQQAFWMQKLSEVRGKMAKGEARPSFTRQYLESQQTSNLSGDYEGSSVIGMMALVGIFTIAGPLHYFLIAMVFHQDWLAKCQAEIDSVCKGRLPTLHDSPKLPILRACILETLRWKPNVPTGVAHEVEEDDFYRDVFIKKGTRILPLDWAFMRNPEKYPDPENYHPERYLEPSWPTYRAPLTMYPNIKGLSSFGYGQRQCLGQTLTQDELLLACGSLCWGFNMSKKIDPQTGMEIDIDLNASNSLLIVKPDPFKMQFTPRSPAKKQAMLKQWEEAEKANTEERVAFLRAARSAKIG
ncbi:putative O-methylsterigmatocystin oxidoreductase [Mollisia scopiformis]|uniref:Putative O-methylsterigmatocystin oxidoreductase n=1 Tax=Mollisia scopiformis TaxID=149040 RepID=A0A194XM54_MOLSC|nr:putative O-methylsterigmatocystin oxidoreductase [Mollisia scopiformis]KUJ21258.1 putative O-methylsterigmatocystin oxidoreductase [Mollisia scopiformis]